MGPGGGKQIRYELRRDGDPGTVLAVLPGVSVIGDHHGDAPGRSPLESVDHNQQLQQMLVDRIAGRLHDKNVGPANILQKLKVHFSVREPLQAYFAQRHSDKLANLFRQRQVGSSREDLKALVLAVRLGAFASGCRSGLGPAGGWYNCAGRLLLRHLGGFRHNSNSSRSVNHDSEPPSWFALVFRNYNPMSAAAVCSE